jgi:two-component system, OmpR family, sensor kinase
VSRRDPDDALVARARRRIMVQTAGAITLSLLVVGVLVFIVVAHAERAAAETLVRHTATTEDDVKDPPPATWIFEEDQRTGELTGTAAPPSGFPDRAELDRVRTGGAPRTVWIDDGRGHYVQRTQVHEDKVVQVVVDQRDRIEEARHLAGALGLAEAAGLAIAVLSTVLLARRATAPLREALARQRRFVADASHELRTPLTQLHTRAQLLQRDLHGGSAGSDIADDVAHLVTGTRHLSEVVDDLLLSTQLPQRPDEVAIVDLAAVASDVVATYAVRATAQQVELALLRDPAQAARVHGREPALRRVLTALVDNALSHTAPGGHVTVECTADRRSHIVEVVVRDDGAGFDPADAERLFARFARGGHDDHRRFGLGLALTREVVTGHGGTIEAWGRPGEGATFTVRLPDAQHTGSM